MKTPRQKTWKNLAPAIYRQRVVIEGTTDAIVEPQKIKQYLKELSKVLNMKILREPFAYAADELGYGGWVHWRTSGAHFYSYPSTPPLFTVDAYTCKRFAVHDAVKFTRVYLQAKDIVWREIEI